LVSFLYSFIIVFGRKAQAGLVANGT